MASSLFVALLSLIPHPPRPSSFACRSASEKSLSTVDYGLEVEAATQLEQLEKALVAAKRSQFDADAEIATLKKQLSEAEAEVERLRAELSRSRRGVGGGGGGTSPTREDEQRVAVLTRALRAAHDEVQRLTLAAKDKESESESEREKEKTPAASPFRLSAIPAAAAQSPEVVAIASVLHESMAMMHSHSTREEDMRREMEAMRTRMLEKRVEDADAKARRLEHDLERARTELASERQQLRQAENELRRVHGREVEDLRRALERERGRG